MGVGSVLIHGLCCACRADYTAYYGGVAMAITIRGEILNIAGIRGGKKEYCFVASDIITAIKNATNFNEFR